VLKISLGGIGVGAGNTKHLPFMRLSAMMQCKQQGAVKQVQQSDDESDKDDEEDEEDDEEGRKERKGRP
jgi:hypothetical protein